MQQPISAVMQQRPPQDRRGTEVRGEVGSGEEASEEPITPKQFFADRLVNVQ